MSWYSITTSSIALCSATTPPKALAASILALPLALAPSSLSFLAFSASSTSFPPAMIAWPSDYADAITLSVDYLTVATSASPLALAAAPASAPPSAVAFSTLVTTASLAASILAPASVLAFSSSFEASAYARASFDPGTSHFPWMSSSRFKLLRDDLISASSPKFGTKYPLGLTGAALAPKSAVNLWFNYASEPVIDDLTLTMS